MKDLYCAFSLIELQNDKEQLMQDFEYVTIFFSYDTKLTFVIVIFLSIELGVIDAFYTLLLLLVVVVVVNLYSA